MKLCYFPLLVLGGFLVTNMAFSAPVVKSAEVQYQDYAKSILISGKLANKAEQKLSFKISGLVASIQVEEGQQVKAGQLLARLDEAEINAQVEQAQSVYNNAKSNLARLNSLYKDSVISQEQLNNMQTQLQVAQADLQIAQFNQKHAEIRANSDGWVLQRNIEINELVTPNQPAFIISNAQKGWILRAGVTDKDIVRIEQDNQVDISIDAYPGQIIRGHVNEIAAAANASSGLFEVEVQLDKPALKLYSGFVAQGEIYSGQTQSLAFLPIESIVSANGRTAQVFVIDHKQAVEQRNVELAFIKQDKVAILSGVNDGEQVVSIGAAYLRDGMSVELTKVR
ncbi:efflux RND transporter periplasmic adaptor subunit [Neptunicella sp. SCSIO 80796]|uniref:efflux RND transporter periplasmic adaptor subunit n=1 Tax=Neptunicella plasticusilytica TaxID=3117012 RepID=UPI003A4DCD2C